MNNVNDKNLEEILGRTLEYLDRGKSSQEILDLLPEHRETLKEIFSAINLLKKESESIIPPKELFKQIIEQIPGGVTNKVGPRYLYRGKKIQGRPSETIIKQKIHELMTINWKIWAPIGVIAVVALVAVGYSRLGTKAPQVVEETPLAPIAAPAQELPVAVTKPATGNIDDAVNTILASIADDEALFANEEKDAELIATDSQALSDFGQSYNENEF